MKSTYTRPYGDTGEYEYGMLHTEGVSVSFADRFEMVGVAPSFEDAQNALIELARQQRGGDVPDAMVDLAMNEAVGRIEEYLGRMGFLEGRPSKKNATLVEAVAERVADRIKRAHANGEATY